jgi:hypothetical protein
MLASQVDNLIDIMVGLRNGKSENHCSMFDKSRKFLTSFLYSDRLRAHPGLCSVCTVVRSSGCNEI